MLIIALALLGASFVVSLLVTGLAKRYALKLGLMDQPGERKVHAVPTPRNGGIGIFWGLAVPIILGLVAVYGLPSALATIMSAAGHGDADDVTRAAYLRGLHYHAPLALLLLLGTAAIHALGLLDDRRPMRPWPKLLGQLAIAAALVGIGECIEPGAFRVLVALDHWMPAPLGMVLSAGLSVFWIVALTNAFNFLDHMDGLSAGVALCCAVMFLIAAYLSQQWFICGLLLLFMGALLGFLCYNFPPATIFMGDGGSMLLGFFLSVLTIRTTYLQPSEASAASAANRWYSILAPLIILAVPLYDLLIVCILRVARGRSPMSADTNHFSHRLVRHGFSKRSAVLVIYAVTLATGLSAPLLVRADQVAAILIAVQVAAMLIVIAILERVGDHTN